jgi:hypothetical protein
MIAHGVVFSTARSCLGHHPTLAAELALFSRRWGMEPFAPDCVCGCDVSCDAAPASCRDLRSFRYRDERVYHSAESEMAKSVDGLPQSQPRPLFISVSLKPPASFPRDTDLISCAVLLSHQLARACAALVSLANHLHEPGCPAIDTSHVGCACPEPHGAPGGSLCPVWLSPRTALQVAADIERLLWVLDGLS